LNAGLIDAPAADWNGVSNAAIWGSPVYVMGRW
jgi:hypothetical protein